MQAHERITTAIRAANKAGRPALVPFITAGYPEPADFVETLKAVAAVGDVVELGIPFSDPMADGMTIQRSSFEALKKGVSLEWIFEQLDSAKGDIDAPLVMMSYLNPLLAYGYDRLAERALAAGVCGFIVPDLPYEESDEIRDALDVRGLGLIQLVTPATPPARLETLCAASRGFVYAVTITGITGGTGLPAYLAAYLKTSPQHRACRCAPASVSVSHRTSPPSASMRPALSSARRWWKCSRRARIRNPSCGL